MPALLRYLWSSPTSLLGLTVALLALPQGRARFVQGVLEVHGPLLGWALTRLVPIPGGAAALTLGHVVLGRDAVCLTRTRAHERVHVEQCERWGPFFVPAYLLASLCLLVAGRDAHHDNPFEREAHAREHAQARCPRGASSTRLTRSARAPRA